MDTLTKGLPVHTVMDIRVPVMSMNNHVHRALLENT